MDTIKNNRLLVAFALVIVLAVIAALVFRGTHGATSGTSANLATTSSATTTTTSDAQITGTGNYTVTQLPDETIPAPPNYKTPLVFSASVSADVRTALNAQFADTESALAKDPTNFDALINLGIIRKMGGDYTGAATDWQYAAILYPKSQVPFDDLGDLYTNFIKAYPQAAAEYKQALKDDPTDMTAYQGLFALYTTYGYGSSASAIALLKQGIAANPKNIDLELMLARYYKSQSDSVDATAEYNAAIANARSQGQTALVAQIQQEASGQ